MYLLVYLEIYWCLNLCSWKENQARTRCTHQDRARFTVQQFLQRQRSVDREECPAGGPGHFSRYWWKHPASDRGPGAGLPLHSPRCPAQHGRLYLQPGRWWGHIWLIWCLWLPCRVKMQTLLEVNGDKGWWIMEIYNTI